MYTQLGSVVFIGFFKYEASNGNLKIYKNIIILKC